MRKEERLSREIIMRTVKAMIDAAQSPEAEADWKRRCEETKRKREADEAALEAGESTE